MPSATPRVFENLYSSPALKLTPILNPFALNLTVSKVFGFLSKVELRLLNDIFAPKYGLNTFVNDVGAISSPSPKLIAENE